jgi:hypothetical protein
VARPFDDLFRDIRHAVRSLRRSPGFSLTAIVTLGLGLGANAAIFSVLDAALLRPLPYPESDRIVTLHILGRESEAGEPDLFPGRTRNSSASAPPRAASARWRATEPPIST